jgi:hypothetical protein
MHVEVVAGRIGDDRRGLRLRDGASVEDDRDRSIAHQNRRGSRQADDGYENRPVDAGGTRMDVSGDTGARYREVASRGTLNVIVADPRPPDSAFETAGTSFDASSGAVKMIGPDTDGPVGPSLSLSQATHANITMTIASRFIGLLLPQHVILT